MTKVNFLVEMSNDCYTLRDESGIAPVKIVEYIEQYGKPTHLEGRFGERSRRPDGYDVAGIDKFLSSRDASWFPTSEPTPVSTEGSSDD